MKAIHTEEFYRKNWDRFLGTMDHNYMNLEAEMERKMAFADAMVKPEAVPEEEVEKAIEMLRRKYAEDIAREAEKKCREMMAVVRRLKGVEGASLGYTTQNQEFSAQAELVERFEFNCLQLADFRKKYLAS